MTVYRVPVQVSYTHPGGPGVNVWHVRTSSLVEQDSVNLQQAVDQIRTFYEDIGPFLSSGTAVDLLDVVNVEDNSFATPTWTTLNTGAVGNDAPPFAAIVAGWRTSLAARRGMGRTFLGPLAASSVSSDGNIAGTARDNVITAANTLLTASKSTANEWAVCVYGLVNKAPTGTKRYDLLPHTARDITAVKVGYTLGSLRSRRD